MRGSLASRSTLLAMVCLLPGPDAARSERLALVDATILDPADESQTRGTLILDRGLIAARVEALPAGFEGTVIDLEGKFVTAGLNDLHVRSYGNAAPGGQVEIFSTAGTAERMLSVGVTGFLDLSSFEDATLDLPGAPAAGDVPLPAATGTLVVQGVVRTASGYALSHVDVGLRRTGATEAELTTRSATDGSFRIEGGLETISGAYEVIATYPGFDPVIERIEPGELPATLEMTMSVAKFQDAIVVEASSPTDESRLPRHELEFLDIVATAGSNADPLFAAQALPGVVKLDEGSGLFVRGGDASEVATYLDLALLDHPYRHETPTGGFFGTVDAFELQGLSLSSGGFPARYGNSLSAVLELRTRDQGQRRAMQLGVGLAALSASLETPLGGGASLRLAANHRDAKALVALNDPQLDFREAPKGTDLSLSVLYRPSDRQRLHLTAYDQSSSLGTELESGNFAGTIDTGDRDRILNLAWSRSFGSGGRHRRQSASMTLTLSRSEHGSEVRAGVLEIGLSDRTWRARVDLEASAPAGWRLRSGAVIERSEHRSIGTLPEVSGDFGGDRGRRLWAADAPQRRAGLYLEAERPMGRRLAFNLGARYDDWGWPDRAAIDPRASFSLRTGRRSHLRMAWGRYHQSPQIEYLTLGASTGELEIAEAEHRVISWQLYERGDPFQLRIEAYDKRYGNLPLQTTSSIGPDAYRSGGHGFARGVDLFLGFKVGDPRPGLGSGWRGFLAYTYLEAERLFTPWQDRDRYEAPSEPYPPDFAIPHTLQLVLHKVLPLDIDGSLGVRLAAGRPFTPVIGTEESARGLLPLYGPINSDRLPDFRRLDVSASRPFAVGDRSTALVYLGVNDLLDRRNAFRTAYSPDWSERRLARTAFGRTVYFGVTLRR